MSNKSATFEERTYWSNKLFDLLREMREFDRQNKSFLLKCIGAVVTVAGIIIGAVLAVITGGKIKFPSKD